MPTLQLVVPGLPATQTPRTVITSGVVPPTTLQITNAEHSRKDLAPDWVEIPRPGRQPIVLQKGLKRPAYDVEALVWYEDGRSVEPDMEAIRRHASGIYGVTFGFGSGLAGHRWAIFDLSFDVEMVSPVDNSAVRAAAKFSLKELFSDAPTGQGPVPGVPPEAIVDGPPPAIPAVHEGPHRWVVRTADTLSRIAVAAYNDQAQWRNIAKANGLADPRRLTVGQVLVLP